MSLIASASPWSNTNSDTKKWIPSFRKTIKKVTLPNEADYEEEPETVDMATEVGRTPVKRLHSGQSGFGPTLWSGAEVVEESTQKVTSLLEKMTSAIHTDNDGSGLANFQPLQYPEMTDLNKRNGPVQSQTTKTLQRPPTSTNFSANPPPLEKTGDYRQVYNTPNHTYYTAPGAGVPKNDDKLWDRLSYIIHLLEEQQNERTEHVMEEYILYVLLGTFVIFVVDSFSRSGRYIR